MFDSAHDKECLLVDGRVSPDIGVVIWMGERLRLAMWLGEHL